MMCHQCKFIVFAYLIVTSIASETDLLKKISTRIIGGSESSIKKIGGFLVALRYNGDFLCGGSYISNRIVLSAAHCIFDLLDTVSLLTVQGGISNLNEESSAIQVERALIPTKYNKIPNDLDIAVLLLKSPLKGNLIRKIKLCTNQLKNGDLVRVSGWGLTNFSETRYANTVRSVIVPIVDKAVCKKTLSNVAKVTDSMLCAGVPNRKDACQYDSGGPLVFRNELCGVVSYGIDCASEFPGVYADVKYLTNWINETIQKLLPKGKPL